MLEAEPIFNQFLLLFGVPLLLRVTLRAADRMFKMCLHFDIRTLGSL